ncbi:MAG TPA: YhjD/YihY/BrkB family envelope integrity protein [Jatrophihabitans sp.]|nr:YhjD/YihY/BrkB family envelope integrity protein [Jatrophihabitans sp.]
MRHRYARVAGRVDASSAGLVRRRWRELDIMHHGLLLASLGLTLLVPALITITAVLPLGRESGFAGAIIRRFGLAGQSADDLRKFFPSREHVAGATTVVSAVATLFWSLGWPAELARGYNAIWGVSDRGVRDLWRAVPWLASFVAVIAYVMVAGMIADGTAGRVVQVLLAVPIVLLWSWFSQHLLLGARVSWRALVPGAVATTVALVGFSIGMSVYIPRAIVHNFEHYGPLGIIFVMLTWLVGFAVVMLGGALVGHMIFLGWHPDAGPVPTAANDAGA